MPAWAEARRLSSAIRSAAAKPGGVGDEDGAVKMLRDWFSHIYRHYNPDTHRCIFNGKECSGKTTSGHINGFGAVWKCQSHQPEYDEIRTAFKEN